MTDIIVKNTVANEEDVNRDPISGATGAHPLGTGAGAVSGGIAGAAVGIAVGGPIGAMIGAAVGAVTGGLAGSSAAEAVNPTAEELFWKETFVKEPYYVSGHAYEYYAPAFRAGWEGRVRHDGRSFVAAEADLRASYNAIRSELEPEWHEVRPAALAAWSRVDRGMKASP